MRSFSSRRRAKNSLLLALVTFLVLPLSGCNDREESFYPRLADAGKDGAIDRGWVPDDLLPGSVRNINEVHELSPSREWCASEFDPQDSQKLRSVLKNANSLPPAVKRIPRPGVKWWPTVLTGKLNLQGIHKAGLELSVIERPETSVTSEVFLFAISWPEGRGFLYSTPE